MQTVDELHHLVHSLTASEKRAFTMHARRHVKNPQYLRLFTALDRIKQYDASVVRKAFKGTLVENNLNELRYALLEELVACVDRLKTSDDVLVRHQREVEAIEFLAARGCYSTAERRLRRARASARAHELPSAILDLCSVQRRTMPLSTELRRTLVDDEHVALVIARDHHDAARVLDRWTQCATSMERFTVSTSADPFLQTPSDISHAPSDVSHAPSDVSPGCDELSDVSSSTLGALRRLHANILRASCMRDADAMVAFAHALSCLLVERSTQLVAYTADVNSALVDLADEAALMGITSRLHSIPFPNAVPHAHLPRHRVATLMRSALVAESEGNADASLRIANIVLNDAVLSQAHEAWTAQATLLVARLYLHAGHHSLVAHIVRSALRTEERRRRFTREECDYLKSIRKLKPQPNGSASGSRSALSANTNVLRVGRY